MPASQPLAQRTAVVTGASSGIGRAIALALGEAGAHVVLAGRTRAPMEEAAKQIGESGGQASVVVADLRDVAQVRELIEGAARDTGRLDILVNNAGLSHPAGVIEGDPEEWREMLELNVLALLVGCQTAVKAMRACGAEGHVVNVSSIAALRRDSGVYGATKHAVNCITNTLRGELEEDSIRVVNIMPGAIATNFARNFDPEFVKGFAKMSGVGEDLDIEKGARLPDEVIEALQPKMKQLLGNAEDVAKAVVYAVTQPIEVNVSEIVVRPPKQMNL